MATASNRFETSSAKPSESKRKSTSPDVPSHIPDEEIKQKINEKILWLRNEFENSEEGIGFLLHPNNTLMYEATKDLKTSEERREFKKALDQLTAEVKLKRSIEKKSKIPVDKKVAELQEINEISRKKAEVVFESLLDELKDDKARLLNDSDRAIQDAFGNLKNDKNAQLAFGKLLKIYQDSVGKLKRAHSIGPARAKEDKKNNTLNATPELSKPEAKKIEKKFAAIVPKPAGYKPKEVVVAARKRPTTPIPPSTVPSRPTLRVVENTTHLPGTPSRPLPSLANRKPAESVRTEVGTDSSTKTLDKNTQVKESEPVVESTPAPVSTVELDRNLNPVKRREDKQKVPPAPRVEIVKENLFNPAEIVKAEVFAKGLISSREKIITSYEREFGEAAENLRLAEAKLPGVASKFASRLFSFFGVKSNDTEDEFVLQQDYSNKEAIFARAMNRTIQAQESLKSLKKLLKEKILPEIKRRQKLAETIAGSIEARKKVLIRSSNPIDSDPEIMRMRKDYKDAVEILEMSIEKLYQLDEKQ